MSPSLACPSVTDGKQNTSAGSPALAMTSVQPRVPRAHLQLLVLPLQVLQDELQLVLVLALALTL